MKQLSLLTLITTLVTMQSHLFVKSALECQLMQTYSPKNKVQLNSQQEKPPVTGQPDDRKPAGTYARIVF